MSSETRNREDDVFRDHIESQDEPTFRSTQNVAKAMAKQQLCVSEDSPFNLCRSASDLEEAELDRLREEKARELRQETDEIKQQLELVKGRLAQIDKLKDPPQASSDSATSGARVNSTTEQLGKIQDNFGATSNNRQASDNKRHNDAEPRLRPLTGKADCPNCVCDRRTSVCDQCIQFKTAQPEISPIISDSRKSNGSEVWKQVYKTNYNNDDRPIRPAKDRKSGTVEVVDEVVVPNQVYTISKSLNDKRTKLAQAIEELQLMIEKVKERDKRLNEDRKLVQQYKQQWKYGPNIGGPLASSRDRTGGLKGPPQVRRSYESRLDSDLSRDSRSLMGFQQVAPSSLVPPPKPAVRKRLLQARQQTQPNTRLTQNSRSKSLESLERTDPAPKNLSQKQHSSLSSKFHNNRSSSNIEAFKENTEHSPSNKGQRESESSEETEIEELTEFVENDTGPKECESRPTSARTGKEKVCQNEEEVEEQAKESPNQLKEQVNSNETVKKMNWIPVFGETEVKTLRPRTTPNRKVVIMNKSNSPTKSSLKGSTSLRQVNGSARSSVMGRTNNISNLSQSERLIVRPQPGSNNIVLNEATKRLRFAQDLLEQEKSDSKSANQLVINRSRAMSPPKPTPRRPPTRQSSSIPPSPRASHDKSTGIKGLPTASTTSEEVLRLEQMVSEQQKLVDNLVNRLREQQRGSPITVQCSSPCCHQQPVTLCKSRSPTDGSSRSPVIQHLKEKLNKTKSRLMKMLEEEREKHQQLKQKVDSSLRKQSDLENENHLLKQSLNKCIDTCLRDISSTFESLGDSLADSIVAMSKQPATEDDVSSIEGGNNLKTYTNAAQLIAENRHLKKMKSHIETIESQRREIFEELRNEKQKVGRLESQLRESQHELEKLSDVRLRLESQLELSIKEQQNLAKAQSSLQQTSYLRPENDPQTLGTISSNVVHDEKSATTDTDSSSQDQLSSGTKLDSTDSIALYTRFIKSMTPDLDSMMREHKQMISELNLARTAAEKMMSEMAN